MLIAEMNRGGLALSFDGDGAASAPRLTTLSLRKAYYHLVNVEEHPEILPLAHDLVRSRLDAAADCLPDLVSPGSSAEVAERLADVLERLQQRCDRVSRHWQAAPADLHRRLVLHYFVQHLPTAVVDGCWLQCGLRVATAHTELGALLCGMYQQQLRAFVSDPGRHFAADYRAAYERLRGPADDVASHSFAERTEFLESSLALPVFLLAIAQFPRSYTLEILGLQLSWQFLGLSVFGPGLVRDTCTAYALPPPGDDLADAQHFERSRALARAAALRALEGLDGPALHTAWQRLMRGVAVTAELWEEWFEATTRAAPSATPDARQEMLDLLQRKAPHACGFHGNRTLGARRIDEHLNPRTFDGPSVLAALATSPWVKAGKADKSALLNRLIDFGGPMMAVFSPAEQCVIRRWIDSLDADASQPDVTGASLVPPMPVPREEQQVSGRSWEPAEFSQRSARRYGKVSVRDLYHFLVNVEFYPDVLPHAEKFARERLERSMAMLWKGDRPIPSTRYDPAALEAWVYDKHREQVESYRAPEVLPEVSRDAFVEATVQLAPLILIDGGWLQGMASPALIHTTVARTLFHILVEEIGEGNPAQHHANIFRDLLAAMGVQAPQVDTLEFAHWSRLQDASFEVPALWLSISCFPRHFMPEILGLNLAVELAGVGGPYMEARDTLRRFRLPTLFVDVHNAADNVSVGHSAWAMNAIKRHMDEVAERDGPHNVDRVWHRVWSGVRATLPQIGHARMVAHRLSRRLFGKDPSLTPPIFPS